MNPITTDDAGGWVKSRRCSATNCVEVRRGSHVSLLRDSKQNGLGIRQPIITLDVDQWDGFADAALSNREPSTVPGIQHHKDGAVTLSQGDTDLDFDADEWAAFVDGLADGDFD